MQGGRSSTLVNNGRTSVINEDDQRYQGRVKSMPDMEDLQIRQSSMLDTFHKDMVKTSTEFHKTDVELDKSSKFKRGKS